MENGHAKIIGISRHRLSTDGDGVITLVAFHGCPLRCLYCLNPQSLGDGMSFLDYSPEVLYAETRIDELYFLATNGGITFAVANLACIRNSSVGFVSCAVPLGRLILKPRSMFRLLISKNCSL